MNRRNFLARMSAAFAGGLITGNAALEAYERLMHRRWVAMGSSLDRNYIDLWSRGYRVQRSKAPIPPPASGGRLTFPSFTLPPIDVTATIDDVRFVCGLGDLSMNFKFAPFGASTEHMIAGQPLHVCGFTLAML